MSWRGAQTHLDRMLGLAHLGGVGIITRDRDSGEVRVGKDGEPTVQDAVSERDRSHMRQGIAGAARILEAAGATSMFTGHQAGITWNRDSGEPVERFLTRADAAGYDPGRCAMAALHIMGTARMGGSPETSATDPDGATWEVGKPRSGRRLIVPCVVGVNPMVSVEAMGVMNARRLAARL
ncbi:MAG: GMC oxidoreductase [Candidatus Nanopelagicales bacterium]